MVKAARVVEDKRVLKLIRAFLEDGVTCLHHAERP